MTRRILISALVMCSSLLVWTQTLPAGRLTHAGEYAANPSIRARECPDSLLVLFWNVENLFDCEGENGGKEWTPAGEKHWTPGRLRAKCNAIGKTLLWIGEQEGRLPDVVGLAEVENAGVLRRLVYSAPLRKAGYRYVHFDSPDPRGIDVALLYRKDVLARPKAEALPVPGFRTRDILRCRFPLFRPKLDSLPSRQPSDSCSGAGIPIDSLTVVVVHHPSKLGGPARSQPRRQVAMSALREACGDTRAGSSGTDSLPTAASCSLTVVTGDFNDTPDGEAFQMLDSCLVCLSRPLHRQGEGTLKYDGKWELIDQFWVSPDLVEDGQGFAKSTQKWQAGAQAGRWRCETAILYAPFLLTRDSAHAGEKPLRTYSGPRYLGGVSDHLPVLLRLRLKTRE